MPKMDRLVATNDSITELKRVIGPEGRALLQRHQLLTPLVQQLVIRDAIAETSVDPLALDQAKLELLTDRGYESLDQWPEALQELGHSEELVLEQISRGLKLKATMREEFAAKAEARFLQRKNELDQVVYSLLRLENRFLAQELYLQIESGESNFADLAKRYAEGPERNTNGIVGPVPLTQAHPALVEKLRVSQPGVLQEPFRISDWWLVVRLERYSPATFTDAISDQMCREMFDEWIEELTATSLSRLSGSSEVQYSDDAVSAVSPAEASGLSESQP